MRPLADTATGPSDMPDAAHDRRFALSELRTRLRANALEILGSFEIGVSERPIPDRERQPRALAIVGNAGSAIWPVFETARKDRPALTLDRWTEETVDKIASDFGIEAVYPFEGPPFHPFVTWARRTQSLFPSPLGLTIHPVFGLWHAFRAALLFDRNDVIPVGPAQSRRPCDDCPEKPCLTACPVDAFGGEGYDFGACLDHLSTPVNACRQSGCLARVACPVGREYRYHDPHAAFHMQQLLKAHGRA